jgi:hypothetical protein
MSFSSAKGLSVGSIEKKKREGDEVISASGLFSWGLVEPGMDERLLLFVWALCGLGVFGLLGAGFGALAGAVTRASGGSAGSLVGMAVAQALARVRGKDLSPVLTGAVVGAVDGACFLGVAGTVLGVVAGYWGLGKSPWLAITAWGVGLLFPGAILFGLLAYGLVRAGSRAVAAIFLGALGGACAGFQTGGARSLFLGALGGALLGSLGAILWAGTGRSPTSSAPEDEEEEK